MLDWLKVLLGVVGGERFIWWLCQLFLYDCCDVDAVCLLRIFWSVGSSGITEWGLELELIVVALGSLLLLWWFVLLLIQLATVDKILPLVTFMLKLVSSVILGFVMLIGFVVVVGCELEVDAHGWWWWSWWCYRRLVWTDARGSCNWGYSSTKTGSSSINLIVFLLNGYLVLCEIISFLIWLYFILWFLVLSRATSVFGGWNLLSFTNLMASSLFSNFMSRGLVLSGEILSPTRC